MGCFVQILYVQCIACDYLQFNMANLPEAFPRELGGRASRSEGKKEEWKSFLSLSLILQKSVVYHKFTPPPKKK